MGLRILMLGDVVGKPGRRVVEEKLPGLREKLKADVVIANGENIAGGSGITPELYKKLIEAGVDGVTLGDHVYRQKEIIPVLSSAANITRPANLPASAVGRPWMKLQNEAMKPPVYVVTLLGRVFMGNPIADDPFACIDRLLRTFEAGAVVVVEMHCETTSEKAAMGHHLDGRVAAVIGTHTHIPTADAKILGKGTAFITDIGMCGPYDSVIGRKKEKVLEHMTTGMPSVFDVAEGDARLCGVLVEVDGSRRAVGIERVEERI